MESILRASIEHIQYRELRRICHSTTTLGLGRVARPAIVYQKRAYFMWCEYNSSYLHYLCCDFTQSALFPFRVDLLDSMFAASVEPHSHWTFYRLLRWCANQGFNDWRTRDRCKHCTFQIFPVFIRFCRLRTLSRRVCFSCWWNHLHEKAFVVTYSRRGVSYTGTPDFLQAYLCLLDFVFGHFYFSYHCLVPAHRTRVHIHTHTYCISVKPGRMYM